MKRIRAFLAVFVMLFLVSGVAGAEPRASARPLAGSSITYMGPTSATVGDDIVLSARLTDDGGAGLAGRTLSFVLGDPGDETVTSGVTGADGVARAGLHVSNPGGNHTLTVTFAGEKKIAGSTTTATFVVSKIGTTLQHAGATSAYAFDSVTFAAKLVTERGSPLSDAALSFTVSMAGVQKASFEATTGTDGVASVARYLGEEPGDYTVTVGYAGTPYIAGASSAAALALLRHSTSIEYTGATTVAYGARIVLSATVVNTVHQIGAGFRTMTFEVRDAAGASVHSATVQTDSAGRGSTEMTRTGAGEYRVDVSFAGDWLLAPSSTSVVLSVTRVASAVHYTGATFGPSQGVFLASGRLLTVNGPLAGRPVRFELRSPDGVAVAWDTALTDANGTASASVPVNGDIGEYVVAAVFDGDADAAPSEDTVTFNATPREVLMGIYAPESMRWDDDVDIEVRLNDRASGAPMAGRTITVFLTEDGWAGPGDPTSPSSTAVTDANGVATATLHVTLTPPTEDPRVYVGAWFEGDPEHTIALDQVETRILRRATLLHLDGPPASAWRGEHVEWRAHLTDEQRGTGLAGKPVTLELISRDRHETVLTRTATTDTDGFVTFVEDLTVPRAEYDVYARNDGDAFRWSAADYGYLFVGWQYTFSDPLAGQFIRLNPATKEFRFDAPGDSPPDKVDPNMSVTELAGGSQMIVVDFTDDDITLRGVFWPGYAVAATVQTKHGTYVI